MQDWELVRSGIWDINGGRNPRKCIDIDPYSVYEWEIVKDPLEK
jgi:hypothetical protein